MSSSDIQVKMKKIIDNEITTIYPVNRTEDVEGLISALNGKSDTKHTHTKSDISDLNNPTVLVTTDGTSIDLNTVKTPGTYISGYQTDFNNCPTTLVVDSKGKNNYSFSLIILGNRANNKQESMYLTQIIIDGFGGNDQNKIWIREYYGTSWTQWYSLYTTKHKPTVSDITNFPESMKNPNNVTITLNGGVTEDSDKFTYDGNETKTVNITAANIGASDIGHKHTKSDITDFPSTMKNPNNVIITLNDGITEDIDKFTYDGSSAKSINITPDKIGITTMNGATSSSSGNGGLVPVPDKGKQTSFLRGDGTWVIPTNTNTWRPVENVLTSSSTENSLSANQGKVLKGLVDSKSDKDHKHTKSDITDFPTSLPASDVYSWAKASSKPSYTKTDVGLGNVENKSSATIRSELTLENVTTALGYTPLNSNLKGVKNGLAELGEDGKILSSQIPSSIDEIIEGYIYNGDFYEDINHAIEITGESGKIYVDLSSNKTYRWSGSAFIVISDTIALGETSSTAYRGDRGKIAYEHSQSVHAPSDAEPNQNAFTDVSILNGATAEKFSASSPTDTLTMVAGKNTTLSLDTSGKITISSTNTTYNDATQTVHGLLSVSDKKKLDDIESGANKYTLPIAGSELGGVKTASTVTSSTGYLPVPIIDGIPYYKDTNTEYGVGNASTLGLVKLYTSAGAATDGTMTRSAITTALNGRLLVNEASDKDLNTFRTPGVYFGKYGNTATNKPNNVGTFGLFNYRVSTGIYRQDLTAGSDTRRFTREYNDSSKTWTDWLPMPVFTTTPTDNQVIISNSSGQLSSSGYSIKSSVPENAKFTDTTYDDATQEIHGLLSIEDKKKLDSIEEGATKNNSRQITIQLNGGTVEDDNKFTYDGEEDKDIDITSEKLNVLSLDGGSMNGPLTVNDITIKNIHPNDDDVVLDGSLLINDNLQSNYIKPLKTDDEVEISNFTTNGTFEVLDSDVDREPLITTKNMGSGSGQGMLYIGNPNNVGYTHFINDIRAYDCDSGSENWYIHLSGEAMFLKLKVSSITGAGALPYFVIATSDTKYGKEYAHYTCSSTLSINAIFKKILPQLTNGGKIILLDGIYVVNYDEGPIIIDKSNITIEGIGWSSVLKSSVKDNTECSIMKITTSNVTLKNMMIASNNSTTAAPLILQQVDGTLYENLFFILTSSASSTGGCGIRGSGNCSFTRINNCRIYKTVSESTGLPTFDYGYATSFSGTIHECFHSDGKTNITVRFANTTQQNNTIISATKTTNTILSV